LPPTGLNSKLGYSWMVSHHKSLQQQSSIWPTGPYQVTCGLHLEGGLPCTCQWSERPELKQYFLMGGDRLLNEAFNQALSLEASKAASRPPARLQGKK
jgi:hypothetical protein